MSSPVSNIIRTTLHKRPYNILCLPYNGQLEHSMCRSNDRYYGTKNSQLINFPDIWELPHNFIELPDNPDNFPLWLDVDMVVCNSHTKQYEIAQNLIKRMHIPLVLIDHTIARIKVENLEQIKQKDPNSITVAVNPNIQEFWKSDFLLNYSIPNLQINKEKKEKAVVIGNFSFVDKEFLDTLKYHCPYPIEIYGKDPLITQPIRDLAHYYEIFQENMFYIQMGDTDFVSTHLLHAMSAGCVVLGSGQSAKIIEEGQNGYITNNVEDVSRILSYFQKGQLVNTGQMASQFIQQEYSQDKFDKQWNLILEKVGKHVYRR